MSDRIAVMNAGRIEQCGSPGEIYDRPATVFVAGFIGTTNLLRGTATRRGTEGGLVQIEAGFTVTTTDLPEAGGEVTLCLRPESIRVSPAESASPNAIDQANGTLERVIHRGSLTELHVRLPKRADMLIAVRPSGEGESLDMGQSVVATWSGDRIHRIS